MRSPHEQVYSGGKGGGLEAKPREGGAEGQQQAIYITPPVLVTLAGTCAGRSRVSAKTWKAEAPCRVLGPAPGDVGSGHLSLNSGGTALGIQSPAAPLALSSACPRCSSLRGNQSGHLDTLDSTIGWQIRVLLCAVTRNEEVVGTMERIDLEVDACGSHTGLFGVCVGGCSLEQGVKSQETVSRGLKSLLRHPPSQGPACTGH